MSRDKLQDTLFVQHRNTLCVQRCSGRHSSAWHLWQRNYEMFLGKRQFAAVNGSFLAWEFVIRDERGGELFPCLRSSPPAKGGSCFCASARREQQHMRSCRGAGARVRGGCASQGIPVQLQRSRGLNCLCIARGLGAHRSQFSSESPSPCLLQLFAPASAAGNQWGLAACVPTLAQGYSVPASPCP